MNGVPRIEDGQVKYPPMNGVPRIEDGQIKYPPEHA
jgi:hypothetical protein